MNAQPESGPATDNAELTFSPPNLSSMLIINPTYSALPVSLHHKLTFLFFSSPLLLSRPLPPVIPLPPLFAAKLFT